jgi:hypothetical protein
VLERAKALPAKTDEKMRELMLCQAAGPGMTFYNISRLIFQPTEAAEGKEYVSLLSDQDQMRDDHLPRNQADSGRRHNQRSPRRESCGRA